MSALDQTMPADADARVPVAALAGIIATVTVYALAQGLTYPLLSFILQRQGHSAAMVGLSAAMTPLGMITSALLIPIAARWLGGLRMVLLGAASCAMLLALIGWTRDINYWYPLRFLLGMVAIPLYVQSEVWMIALAPRRVRGRLLGLYTATIAAGFAAGPLVLIFVGTEGWPPFLVGIASFAFCGAFLVAVARHLPDLAHEGGGASVRSFLPLATTLLAAVAVAAAFEHGMLSLLPVYLLGFGIGESITAGLLTALIVGNVVIQIPLGMLADRWGARRVLIGCAFTTVIGLVLLPFVVGTLSQWPVVFALGAIAYGIYTMAIVELGERFSGSMLLAGNAAFALFWGIGGMAGPPAAGVAMDLFGPHGLPGILALAVLVLSVVAVARASRHAP